MVCNKKSQFETWNQINGELRGFGQRIFTQLVEPPLPYSSNGLDSQDVEDSTLYVLSLLIDL